MALITPAELKEYSNYSSVQNRTDKQLMFDIVQAHADIIKFTGQDFGGYKNLPDRVRLAALKLAEYYAVINSDESRIKGIKSEKLGDYSYTLESGQTNEVSLANLLDDFVVKPKGTRFRMRSL